MSNVINCVVHWLHQKDKQQHIVVSFGIMESNLIFLGLAQSVFLTFAIGIGKEVWDEYYGTGFCWYDIIGKTLGILMAIVLHEIIFYFFNLKIYAGIPTILF